MVKFDNIYPFTTENISGYMNGINLSGKRVVTVTGSGDHVINAISCGASDITTFDINPLAKYYLDLKISGIKFLPFNLFLKVFLYNTPYSLDYDIISSLPMNQESKDFWLSELAKYGNNGLDLKRSDLFHINYFDPDNALDNNLYLNRRNYKLVKKRLKSINIRFIRTDIKDLVLDGNYDYMFLSNISDYIDSMYDKDSLLKYRELLMSFNVRQIYFAYLYDLGINNSPLSDIKKVREVFGKVGIETFTSAYKDDKPNGRDGVLILRK